MSLEELDKQVLDRLQVNTAQTLETNLVGPQTGAQANELDVKAEAEPLFSMSGTSMLGRAVASTPIPSVYNYIEHTTMEPEEGFNVEDHWEDLTKTVPNQYLESFRGVRSTAEMEYVKNDINQEMEDAQLFAHSGVKGVTANLLGQIVDPVNWVPLGWSYTGTKAVGALAKAGVQDARIASVAYGAGAGLEASVASTALTTLTSPTGNLGDIPAAATMGIIFGSGFGAAGVFEQQANKSLAKFRNEYVPPNPEYPKTYPSDGHEITIGDKSLGAASNTNTVDPNDINPVTADLLKQAEEYIQKTDIVDKQVHASGIGEGLRKLVNKFPLFRTEFDVLMDSGSAIAQMVGHKVYESASGYIRNNKNAAALADMHIGHIAAPVVAKQEQYYKAWLGEMNLPQNSESHKAFLRASEEDMQSMWHDGVPGTQSKAIREFNSFRDEGATRSRRWLQGEENEIGVKGSEDLPDRPGWSPIRWTQEAIDDLYAKGVTKAQVLAGLVDGYSKIHTRLPLEDLKVWANAVMNRAEAMDLGIDTNLVRLLDQEGESFALDMMMNSGITKEKAEALIAALKGLKAEDRKIGPLRSRNEIDLRTPIPGTNYKLIDLIEMDHAKTWEQYSRTVGYAGALARVGIQREDWPKIIDAIKDEMRIKQIKPIEEKHFESLKAAFTGRALGEVNPWVRRMTQTSRLALLNGQGLTQLAETGAIAGYMGMDTFIKSARAEVRDIMRGVYSPAMEQLAEFNVAIKGEHHVLKPERMLDEWMQTPAYRQDLGRFLDKALVKGQQLQQMVSLFNVVHQAQHRFTNRMFLQKMGKIALGKEKLSDARLYDIGFGDKEFFNRVMDNFKKNVEFDDNGVVVNLHREKWSHADFQDFALVSRRVSNQLVQKMLRGESSAWYHDSVGVLMSDLKSFTLGSIHKQLVRNMRMLDPITAGTFMYGFLTAGAVYAAKEAISGKEDKKLSAKQVAKGAFGLGNMTGSVAMMADPVGAILGIDSMRFNNFVRPGSAGSQIMPSIPSLDTVDRMAHIPESLVSAAVGNYDKQDVTALQSLPIIGNLYGFSYMFNRMKANVDERKENEKRLKRQQKREAKAKSKSQEPKAKQPVDKSNVNSLLEAAQ